MTEYEVWQNLRPLESFDNVKAWFEKIHGRTLSSRRASEIACAAKQSREYFRNAKQADYSVRSLLTFYGVASLSRAVTLLLNRNNGEEVLTKGHGLEVFRWSEILSGDISEALRNLGMLEVKTCHGLFEDFLKAVQNTTYMHTCSSGVDACLPYRIPEINKIGFLFHGHAFEVLSDTLGIAYQWRPRGSPMAHHKPCPELCGNCFPGIDCRTYSGKTER